MYIHYSKIILFIDIYARPTIISSNIPRWSSSTRKFHDDYLMQRCLLTILLRFAIMSDNVNVNVLWRYLMMILLCDDDSGVTEPLLSLTKSCNNCLLWQNSIIILLCNEVPSATIIFCDDIAWYLISFLRWRKAFPILLRSDIQTISLFIIFISINVHNKFLSIQV